MPEHPEKATTNNIYSLFMITTNKLKHLTII
ncbi:hypothetical protein MHK_005959 [Candidatus Magnetomorum sp. HK-1]|nr:hypothetical protein MHK_005959 [Candidatus Magnetomorum sp. HK-1]